MKYLVFDTETTGLAQWHKAAMDPQQPKLIQLGCILFDSTHNEIATLKTLVQPLAPIGEKAQATHGISFEQATEMGISNTNAVEIFLDLVDIADVVVAHNFAFDSIVMNHAAYNAGASDNIFKDKIDRCTKEATTNILRIPSTFKGKKYKWPSLEECAQYFFKESVVGAHDAMNDVRMTARVYRSLVENFEERELVWR